MQYEFWIGHQLLVAVTAKDQIRARLKAKEVLSHDHAPSDWIKKWRLWKVIGIKGMDRSDKHHCPFHKVGANSMSRCLPKSQARSDCRYLQECPVDLSSGQKYDLRVHGIDIDI